MVRLRHQILADEAARIGETVRKARAGRVEQQARRLDRIAGDDDVFRPLPAQLSLAVIEDFAGAAGRIEFDARNHRQIADLGPGVEGARQPCHQHALLGVGRAADHAKAAIDARMGAAARRRQGGERGRRPGEAQRLGAARQDETRGVDLVGAIGIAPARRAPGIAHRPRDLQRVLDLGVVAPHLRRRDRPVDAVAEPRARLEPFRAKAQRHHREMHGAAADPLAAVVAAEFERIVAAADPRVGPVQLVLALLVRGEVVERPPERTGVEGDGAEPRLGERAGERAAAGAGADNREIDLVLVPVAAHRPPAARTKHVRRAAVLGARRMFLTHRFAPPPRDRGDRSRAGHSRAGSPGRRSRFRSMLSGGRNRR